MNNPQPPNTDSNSNGAFYVGYLPVPRSLIGFLRVAVPALAIMVGGAAFLMSRSQGDPGTGQWDTSQLASVEGIYIAEPYPMILVLDTDGKKIQETVLLVEEGKHGAQQRDAQLSGYWATARGSIITRDGVRMLELAAGEIGISPSAAPRSSWDPSLPQFSRADETVTLKGEIIDPKCGLGVMRPGQGRTHKECAIRCISGGIPPVFVTVDSAGQNQYYLITDAEGGPAHQLVLPYIAEPVEVTGQAQSLGNISLIRLSETSIKIL